jgi:hypothetical protein
MQFIKFIYMTLKLESDALHVHKLIGPCFFPSSSKTRFPLILTQFMYVKKIHGCFAKARAVCHTANLFVSAPGEVFDECLVTHELWLPRSPDLNSCVYFSLVSLKD